MTNTKFRKRALISSVAMLIVALIALGSATFAWFTNNPDASASGLSMKTKAESGLVILSKTEYDAWDAAAKAHGEALETPLTGDTLNAYGEKVATSKFARTGIILNTASVTGYTDADNDGVDAAGTVNAGESVYLKPVSLNIGKTTAISATDYYTATAAQTNASAAASGTYGTLSGTETYIYSEKIYTKTTDSAGDTTTLAKVKVEGTLGSSVANMEQTIRIAVLDKNDKILGVWAPESSVTYVTSETSGTPEKSTMARNNGSNGTKLYNLVTAGNGSYVSVAPASDSDDGLTVGHGATDSWVTVVVYLDGESASCISDNVNALNELLSSLTVTLSV